MSDDQSKRKRRSKEPTTPEPFSQVLGDGGASDLRDLPISILGVLGGVRDGLRDLLIVIERQAIETGELRHVFHLAIDAMKEQSAASREQAATNRETTVAVRRLTAVVEALLMQRAEHKNGHAPDDTLTEGDRDA